MFYLSKTGVIGHWSLDWSYSLPLAARAVATLAAVTVTPKPGMVTAGTVRVMAPDTTGTTKGADCVTMTMLATHTRQNT